MTSRFKKKKKKKKKKLLQLLGQFIESKMSD